MLICLFFVVSILTRKLTRYDQKIIDQIEHATMCLNFLSAAADVVDFLEYLNIREIVEKINFNLIFGKKKYDFLFLSIFN